MIPGGDVQAMADVIGDMQEAGGESRWDDEELREQARVALEEGRVACIRQRLMEEVVRTDLGQDAREAASSDEEAAEAVLRFLVMARRGWRLEHVAEDWRRENGMPEFWFRRAA